MPTSPSLEDEVRAWLVKAGSDLRAAEVGLRAAPPLLEDVLFHCQQAVEKALKAFLVWHGHSFRLTHDLVEIGGQCVAIDPLLEPLLRRAAPLTQYAWRYRYPGPSEEPAQAEALEALSVARDVMHEMLARLPAEARP